MKKTTFSTAQDCEAAFYEALEACDLEAMMEVWAEDEEVVCVHPGGPRLAGLQQVRVVGQLPSRGAVPSARLLAGQLADSGTPAYVVDAPELYQRAGGPYADAQQRPFADNHLRFARLGWAAADLALGVDPGWAPDLVHAHDWHAALAPACLKAAGARQPSVYTVHNLAYQGDFEAACFAELGLPRSFFAADGMEFWGRLNFMKAGLYYAHRLTTVSPTYAAEIQTPEIGRAHV